MISNEVKERLLQKDWRVKCKTEHELALVLNACLDSGLHWISGDKASFIPESLLEEIPVFIARDSIFDEQGICWDNSEVFQTANSDCEDITNWFFEELRK